MASLFSRTILRNTFAAAPRTTRSFQTSARGLNVASAGALPAGRPVGAFRGGLIGFLLGSSVAAYGTYAWVLKEYRLSNELLTEDIYALQVAVQRIHVYVSTLEEKVEAMQRK